MLHILRNFNHICCFSKYSVHFSFLDDRNDSLFVLSLTHIPKEPESRHLYLSSLDMTLQDPWHDLFIVPKNNYWGEKDNGYRNGREYLRGKKVKKKLPCSHGSLYFQIYCLKNIHLYDLSISQKSKQKS